MKRNFLIINSFILKIIALVLMTFDHVGIFLMNMSGNAYVVGGVFRLIGRFAFPLFVIMLVEGVRHTKSFPKYALRLGIVATMVMIAHIVIYYFFDSSFSGYSPLLDLLCYGTILYLLSKKNKKSFLSIVPFALVILSCVVSVVEYRENININWFPIYLRSGYNIFGLIIALIAYYSYPLLKRLFEVYHMDMEGYETSPLFRFYLNIAYSFAILVAVITIYLLAKIPCFDLFGVLNETHSETWALLSIPFVLLYSGKRGYKAKWFTYASYLYFPLHLVIIYAIFYLISIV